MKKIYCLSVVLIVPFFAFGQIINIPDANFKNRLVNTYSVNIGGSGISNSDADLNNDGEIEVAEAVQFRTMHIDGSNIGSLEGIQYFTNLKYLYCNQNNLTTIDFTTLTVLESAQLKSNQLSSVVGLGASIKSLELDGNQLPNTDFLSNAVALDYLTLSGNQINALSNMPNGLSILFCNYNQLTSIDLTTMPMLVYLECSGNQLTSLDLSNHAIEYLDFSHNLISSIDLSNQPLFYLNAGYNQLTVLQLPASANFADGALDISGNLYTTIDLPVGYVGSFICENTQLTSLVLPPDNVLDAEPFRVRFNAHLEYINAKNSSLCIYDPDWVCMMQITDNPLLHYMCVPESLLQSQATLDYMSLNNDPNMVFSSYCDFTPGGWYNTVTGNIKLDMGANGCDTSDSNVDYLPINFTNGASQVGATYSNNQGNYTVFTSNQVTINPVFTNPYYTISPASYTSSFLGYNNTDTVNFCVTPNGEHHDVQVSIVPMSPLSPGFVTYYKLIYKNKGTVSQSGTITAHYNEALLDFYLASPDATNIAGTLSWNYADLQPLETREVGFALQVNAPTETPPVNIGMLLSLSADITPEIGDETYLNNHDVLTQTVTGSFDPNDKTVSKLNAYVDAPEEYLQYTIRFQNTGTAAAHNVVVKDMLADKLDKSSLEIIATSHNCRTSLQGQKLEFFFEDINLPDSASDEPASHGYVTFKIKALPTVSIGDIITNEANIYFDFNFPILTNPVSTIYQTVLATKPFENDDVFTIYPNPTCETLQLVATTDSVKSIGIYNVLGQLVQSFESKNFEKNFTLNVSQLQSGTYFVELVFGRRKSTQKFIKY